MIDAPRLSDRNRVDWPDNVELILILTNEVANPIPIGLDTSSACSVIALKIVTAQTLR